MTPCARHTSASAATESGKRTALLEGPAGQGGSETPLDVEQSGSMASGANIGFDISVSWGKAGQFTTPGCA